MRNPARYRRLFKFYNEAGEKSPASEIAYKWAPAKARERFLIALLEKSDVLTLDVGCGDGHYRPYIEDYVGLDISAPRLKMFEGRKAWALAEYLPFQDDVFDRVFMSEVLEHTWQRQRILNDCHRVLKKGGILIMSTPFGKDRYQIQSNWETLGKYGVGFSPYIHGQFSEKYTRRLLKRANLALLLLHKIEHNGNAVFIITVSVKDG